MTLIPEGSVVVTPADMYRELRATHDEVKALAEGFKTFNLDVRDRVADHEVRLRKLEQAYWKLAGVAAVAATILAWLGNRVIP